MKHCIKILLFLLLLIVLSGCGENGATDEADKYKYDYYYSQLNDLEQTMYMAYMEQIEHANEDGYSAEYFFPADKRDDYSSEATFVQYCLFYDHPEFYLHENNLDWTINQVFGDADGGWNVKLNQKAALSDYEKEKKELEEYTEKFMSDIDLDQSEYDIALQIHDKLIEEYEAAGPDEMVINDTQYHCTVYGALIGKNGNRNLNCEGASDSFIYFLKKAGIVCAPVFGGIGNDMDYDKAYEEACSYEGRHEWVIAFLDGKWYEIDPLHDKFDENLYDEPYKTAMLEDEHFINDRKHKYWAKTTEQMKNIGPCTFLYEGENISGEAQYSVHVRATDPNWYGQKKDDLMNRFIRQVQVLPVADQEK